MDRTALSHNEFVYGLFSVTMARNRAESFLGGWRNVKATEDLEPEFSFAIDYRSRMSSPKLTSTATTSWRVSYCSPFRAEVARRAWHRSRRSRGDCQLDRGQRAWRSTDLVLENGAGSIPRSQNVDAAGMGVVTGVRLATALYARIRIIVCPSPAGMAHSGADSTMPACTVTRILKTGSLDDVVAVAGYLQARSGRRYAVVTMQNHKEHTSWSRGRKCKRRYCDGFTDQ